MLGEVLRRAGDEMLEEPAHARDLGLVAAQVEADGPDLAPVGLLQQADTARIAAILPSGAHR